MSYEYKRLDIFKAFNQLIFIALIFSFCFSWLMVEIHTELYGVLNVFTFAMLALLVLINIKEISRDKKQIFLTLLIFIITLIGMLVNNSSLGVFLVIVNFCLILLISEAVKISKSFMLVISFMFMLFSLYWAIVSPKGFNPNSVGLVALTTYIGSLFILTSIKRKFMKGSLFLIMTFVTLQTIISSKSRSSLLGLAIFLLLDFIIPKKLWLNKKVLKLIYLFITVGSIGSVIFYLYMWENNISFTINGMTKNFFSGRQAIWYELWIAFKDNIIFGIGSKFNLQSHPNLNVHNSMYNILVIYGLPIFLLILIQLWRQFRFLSLDKERNEYFVISVAGFISIAIQSFFENTLISVNFLPIILFLLVVANSTCNSKT